MSNLNALFSTNSKASGSRASANRVSTSTSRASATRSDDVLLLRRILTKIELLQKINEDNQKKLCKLGEDIKSIKEKISVLSFNKESLDVIIKKSSEELIEHSIYPIPGNYKEMAEEIGEKIRNLRSNLSTKVKASIFKIFDKLPPINSNATAAEITAWKRSPIVLECYKKLFTEIENTSEKYIVRIIKNAWPKKEFIPDSHTAWCVSIAEILLNPNNEYIQITEDVVQPFKKIENKIGFNNDSDSEEIAETFERKRKNQMNDNTELLTLGETQARLEKVINKKKMKQTVTLQKSQKKDDNSDDDDDYNNNNNNNDYNNDDYNNNNNDYNDYNNNNVNNEDDFQIIEDDRRFTNN
ncbi:hypothetical protein Glove_19g151 [Diversispora epigaea]|uniref:Uncharacterized protein n=1 Tax=Diversispora epigaea TaxID=1348612 RepID=A0A397JUY1_9GLOM|nr:hypothetical protein Glove_19g151 [Diversispora epigaea]